MVQFAKILSNANFNINYENTKLTPRIELIFLCLQHKYSDEETAISKKTEMVDFRFETDAKGLDYIINELTIMKGFLEQSSELSDKINQIVDRKELK